MVFGDKPFHFKRAPLSIKTERLLLRPIALTDVKDVFHSFTHTVAKHMTPKPATEVSETESFIIAALQAYDEGRDIQLVIEKNSEFLGLIGLHSRKGPKNPEIGLWLKAEAWGFGYGYESVLAIIDWARNNIILDEFVYPVDKNNERSKRIPLRLGAKLVSQYRGQRAWAEDLEIEEYRFR